MPCNLPRVLLARDPAPDVGQCSANNDSVHFLKVMEPTCDSSSPEAVPRSMPVSDESTLKGPIPNRETVAVDRSSLG